ncbi:hypothetical protein [Citricoccus sp. GCM10030269]|uniref:hypothetical protein n=1 Tax=Citricoccus sp. GCM10030269 TaxID=3273388 RepID=UPI003615EF1C
MDILANLQSFTQSLPTALQFVGVMLAAFIPYIEGEGGAVLGAIAGMEPWLAIPVAILANLAIVVLIVLSFDQIRTMIINRRIAAGKTPQPASERQRKVRRALDKYGGPRRLPAGTLPAANPLHRSRADVPGYRQGPRHRLAGPGHHPVLHRVRTRGLWPDHCGGLSPRLSR